MPVPRMTARATLSPAASERQSQAALIEWRDRMLAMGRLPELRLLFAVPNGELRDKRTAALLEAQGVVPGVPDLFMPVARRGAHGMVIEMKTARGFLSTEQDRFIRDLENEGYAVTVCRSWPEAAQYILWYLDGDPEWAPEE